MVTPLGEQGSRGGGKRYFQFFVVHFATEPTITSFCRTTNDTVGGIVERAGELAGLPSPVHAHMLRHGTGYYLANRGTDTQTIQSYLGHNNIQHTVRYIELASTRFQGLWDD